MIGTGCMFAWELGGVGSPWVVVATKEDARGFLLDKGTRRGFPAKWETGGVGSAYGAMRLVRNERDRRARAATSGVQVMLRGLGIRP